jgi:hypothetical protein
MPSLLRDATSASFPTEIMSVQNHLKQEVPKPYKRFYIKAISKPLCRVSYLCWDEPNEPLLRTGIPPLSFIGILATLAEFERDLIRERTMAGLTAARARGRKGGRQVALTKAQVRLAQAAIGVDDITADPVEKDVDQVWACGQDFVP